MELILIRHGETEENLTGIVQGNSPKLGKLTPKGRMQARKLGLKLKDRKIDHIFSSDLQRVKDTVSEIIAFHDLPVVYEKALRERGFGVIEGRTFAELRENFKRSGKSLEEFAPEGGESFLDLQARAVRFVDQLKEKYQSKTVLVCSHGGPVCMILASLYDLSIKESMKNLVSNASITTIFFDQGGVVTDSIVNDISHLQDENLKESTVPEFG